MWYGIYVGGLLATMMVCIALKFQKNNQEQAVLLWLTPPFWFIILPGVILGSWWKQFKKPIVVNQGVPLKERISRDRYH